VQRDFLILMMKNIWLGAVVSEVESSIELDELVPKLKT